MCDNDNGLIEANILARLEVLGRRTGRYLQKVCALQELVAQLRAFAEENTVVVRYEALKLSIRQNQERAREKYHFFRPFHSRLPLGEHLRQMADTLEKRKAK